MGKIIIMGGSFNPPTKAHLLIMQTALVAMQSQKGIFVPVSFSYLKRKMVAAGNAFCLSEKLRYQMLSAMCKRDVRLSVSDIDFGSSMIRAYDTLDKLQKMYPEDTLYFLVGADKLNLACHWAETSDFFERFGLIVTNRMESEQSISILNREPLAKYADRIEVLAQVDGIESISSTAVRTALKEEKDLSEMLCREVEELLKDVDPTFFQEEITKFTGEYDFLDLMYPIKILWEGIEYPCVEAAFQASKSDDLNTRKRFTAYTSQQIREKGSKLKPTPTWEESKERIMKELLLLKFQKGSVLARRLLETGNRVLVFGVKNKKNLFWGVDTYAWTGENKLGKLLMEVRDELQY